MLTDPQIYFYGRFFLNAVSYFKGKTKQTTNDKFDVILKEPEHQNYSYLNKQHSQRKPDNKRDI